jgi:hypothetical protein
MEIVQHSITFLHVDSASVRNYGSSPAHKVGIVFEAREAITIYPLWPAISGPVCEKAEKRGSDEAHFYSTETIFPDTKGIVTSYSVDSRTYTKDNDTYVIGCIAYQSTFDKSWHHTRLLYATPSGDGGSTAPGRLMASNTD